jgi:hypothetical protein
MAMEEFEEFAYWAVVWDGITDGRDGFEPELSIFITLHDTSSIWPIAVGVLDVIMSRGVGLPDIDFDVFNWISVDVFYCANDEAWLTLWVMGDSIAAREDFSFVGVEGAEDGAFCTGGRFRVVDCINKQRKAQNV